MVRDAPEEPTTGQRVHREVADVATDSTIGVPGATPELVAAGLAQIEAARVAFDPSAATHDVPLAGGTLDLPASDQVASAGALDPGQVIGHFVIRARLGEGGMGVVLAGHDADLGRPVAIKVVKDTADHPAYRARLLREAQVMARLEHPNVVRVYEVGSDRGRLFVAMELVDGVTLTTWLKVQRRSWRELLAMFQQVGAGLAAVHRAGLVHRDFKPDNVLVDRDGRARVADFGLARVDPAHASGSSPAFAASLTRTGMMVGTPAYMAPEQHLGGNVDARADQYSFCISLREALIGSRPVKIEDAHWRDVPRAVRAAIDRGASVDVNDRFASMDALLDALARGASRRRTYVAAAAAVIVLVGGGIGAAAVLRESPSRTPDATSPTVIAANASPAPLVEGSAKGDPATGDSRVAQVDPTAPPSDNRIAQVDPTAPQIDNRIALDPTTPATDERIAQVDPAVPSSDNRILRVDPTTPATENRIAKVDPTTPATEKRIAQADPATRATDAKRPAGLDKPAAGSASIAKSTSSSPSSSSSPSTAKPSTPAQATTAGDTVITPMAPVKETEAARKHNEVAPKHEMVAAHRGAVRDALRDFGFLGVTITGDDRDADLRDLEGKLAASTDDLERAMLLYGMGQAERSRDNCIAAAKHWHEGKQLASAVSKASAPETQRRNLAFLFYGRMGVGEAYCALANGRALGMADKLQQAISVMWAAKDPERAEVWFAWGIAMVETGDEKEGKDLLVRAGQRGGSDKLRAAITAYANAVGLKL